MLKTARFSYLSCAQPITYSKLNFSSADTPPCIVLLCTANLHKSKNVCSHTQFCTSLVPKFVCNWTRLQNVTMTLSLTRDSSTQQQQQKQVLWSHYKCAIGQTREKQVNNDWHLLLGRRHDNHAPNTLRLCKIIKSCMRVGCPYFGFTGVILCTNNHLMTTQTN